MKAKLSPEDVFEIVLALICLFKETVKVSVAEDQRS
jgi:hypothetical protein